MKNITVWHKTFFLLFISFFNSIFFYAKDHYVAGDYVKNYMAQSSKNEKAGQELEFFLTTLSQFYELEEEISPQLIHDLDILNDAHNDFFTIVHRYIKTKTHMGTISLLLSLLHPTSDVQKINEKQKIIKYLMENPAVLNLCEQIISLVASAQSSMCCVLSVQDQADDVNEFLNFLRHDMKSSFFYKPISLLGQSMFSWACSILCGYFLAHPDFVDYFTELVHQQQLKSVVQLGCGFGGLSIIALQSIITYQQIKHYAATTDELKRYFLDIGDCFRACLLLSQLVDKVPVLKDFPLFNFFDEFFEHENELNEIRLYMEKIKNSHSFLSLLQSEALCVGYKKLWNAREKMKPLFHMIGQLDIYVAIARLMNAQSACTKVSSFAQASADAKASSFVKTSADVMADKLADKKEDKVDDKKRGDFLPFCFVQCMNEERPFFQVSECWNPLLLTHKNELEIICSDFVLGNQQVNIAIVTGPNTAGKTAITTGFALSILLSQSLGICSAKQCALTPFKCIKVLLPVRSKMISGSSKFKTEIQEIMQLLKELREHNQSNEYVFVVLDEIMSGTDNDTGVLIAREFLNTLLQENMAHKSLIILSTHYHELTNLAQENKQCQNYTLHVVRKQDGSIQRTFKLIPGTSDAMRIAIDLFKEEIKEVFV